jgi:hypothetical protein
MMDHNDADANPRTRRSFLGVTIATLGAAGLAGCSDGGGGDETTEPNGMAPPVAWRAMLLFHLLETVAIAVLTWTTLD